VFGQTGISTTHIFLQEERVMRKFLFVLTAVAVVFAFTVPAMAQESQWSWYGSVKLWTDWERVSKDVPGYLSTKTGSGAAAWTAGTSGPQDDSEVTWKMPTTAIVGANVKFGDITGKWEAANAANGYAAINLRQFWAKWAFSKDGNIEVGQDYTPWFYATSGMCGPAAADCIGIGYGTAYTGRYSQLRLNYMGFSFALVQPVGLGAPAQLNFATSTPTTVMPATSNTDQTLPRIEASYNGNAGPVGFWLGALYQQYKVNYALTGGAKQDVAANTWMVGLGGKYAYGPFYFNAQGSYGRNPYNAGLPANIIPVYMSFDPTTNKSEDAEFWAAQGIIGFKVSDMVSFEGGYLTMYGKVKDLGINMDVEQTVGTWYVQATISPAKNFYIIPEVGDADFQDLKYGSTTTKMGDLMWFGIKWQINF
jgi:hypothetical protein